MKIKSEIILKVINKVADIILIGAVVYIVAFFASLNALNEFSVILNELGYLK